MAEIKVSSPEIEKILWEVIDEFLIPKFGELGMSVEGGWERQLGVTSDATQNKGSITGASYTKYLVQGRGPNADQSKEGLRRWVGWAGSTIIKDWAQRKGIDPKLSYAIAYKIAREGNRFYPGGSDLLEVLSSDECIELINKKLGTLILEKVTIEVKRMLKEKIK